MPPAVDDKARRADNIHALVNERLAGQPSGRQQEVGEQDERRAGPADDFDRDLKGTHAGQLRPSTSFTGTPSNVPGSNSRALTPMRSCGGSVSGVQWVMMPQWRQRCWVMQAGLESDRT